jgi:hypothetical protein
MPAWEGKGIMDRTIRIEVYLSQDELDRLRLLAEELGVTPGGALRQLAAHGRQGWWWLWWIDVRHQLRTLLMQRLRRRGQRVGFRLPRLSDGVVMDTACSVEEDRGARRRI